jgi:hypothetical protein
MGTTQWQLFREYTLEEAEEILEKTRSKGFAFAQVMLMGVGDGTQANVYGEKPWIDNNPLTPNEAYFRNVDAVVEIARQKDVIISMTLYHQRYRACITRSIAPPPPWPRCQLLNFSPVTDSGPCSVCHLCRSRRSRTAPRASPIFRNLARAPKVVSHVSPLRHAGRELLTACIRTEFQTI